MCALSGVPGFDFAFGEIFPVGLVNSYMYHPLSEQSHNPTHFPSSEATGSWQWSDLHRARLALHSLQRNQ